MLTKLMDWFTETLHSPRKVAAICGVFIFCNLFLSGTMLRIWSLHRDHGRMSTQLEQVISKTREIQIQISQAKDPAYVERQAMDRFDMVSEQDLVFYFAE